MKTLKQKIEEAAERRGFSAGLGERWEAEEAFKAGAQFLLDEGYRFTKEDMSNAFNAGTRWNYNPDEFDDFEEWLKERGRHEQRVKK
jgi:hypothetical protein